MVFSDVQRRMLAHLAERDQIPTDEFIDAVHTSPEEFESAARSLGKEGFLHAIVPLGGTGPRAQGAWKITPAGREALRAASESV